MFTNGDTLTSVGPDMDAVAGGRELMGGFELGLCQSNPYKEGDADGDPRL